MNEQNSNPNQSPQPTHEFGSAGKIALAGALILGTNLPGVGYHEQIDTTPVVTQEQIISTQVVDSLPAPKDSTIVLKPDVDNDYRADFQTTPTDAESSENQVASELDAALGQDGWANVYDIQVTGLASAEDEQTGGGLQTDSQANTNLAAQRALLAAAPVMEAFKAKGIDVSQTIEKQAGQAPEAMMKVAGVEDSWSDQDLAQAEGFAEQFGYDSVDSMVEHHNDGGTPPAVNEFLKPLLEDQRGAAITLKLRDANGTDKSVTITTVKNVTKVKQVPTTTHSKDIVDNQTIGVIPVVPLAPKRSMQRTDYPKYREKFSRPTAKGQKPIRHRGRTHMTNPTPM